MRTTYGYPTASWGAARQQMTDILIRYARDGKTVCYSDLVRQITAIQLTPDSDALSKMLEEISTEQDRADKGMLSVLVVHKTGDLMPGPGFYKLAKQLGRDTSDKERCWIDELKRVYEQWAPKR